MNFTEGLFFITSDFNEFKFQVWWVTLVLNEAWKRDFKVFSVHWLVQLLKRAKRQSEVRRIEKSVFVKITHSWWGGFIKQLMSQTADIQTLAHWWKIHLIELAASFFKLPKTSREIGLILISKDRPKFRQNFRVQSFLQLIVGELWKPPSLFLCSLKQFKFFV